jgi:hypothetical protein
MLRSGGIGAGAARDEASAVEEHECALDAEAAQIDPEQCHNRCWSSRPMSGCREAGIGRQTLQGGFDIDDAGILDLLGGDHGGRSKPPARSCRRIREPVTTMSLSSPRTCAFGCGVGSA